MKHSRGKVGEALGTEEFGFIFAPGNRVIEELQAAGFFDRLNVKVSAFLR